MDRQPKKHRSCATTIFLIFFMMVPPIAGAPLRFQYARQIERSKTFTDSSLSPGIFPLSRGGFLKFGTETLILTNDLTVIGTYPGNLRIFGEDPKGGFYCDGDANNFLWRIFDDGRRDESFVSPARPSKGGLGVVVVQPDSKILVSYSVDPFDGTSGFPGNNTGLFRLNIDGSVDNSFQLDFVMNPQTENLIAGGLTVLPDGKIQFGTTRFLQNGQRDPTWNVPSVNGRIWDVEVQPDGKSVICGEFNRVNGIPRAGLARLNLDGTLDFSFQPPTNGPGFGPPTRVVVQGDGRVVVYFEGLAVVRNFSDGRLDPTLKIERNANFLGFAMDRTDRIYTVENKIVTQYSGRDRLTADAEPVRLVLERTPVLDEGWSPVATFPAHTSIDYALSDFPGTGNTFYRARPAP